MHTEPLVTIVTPVYNGESYISECIESIISQRYENWEYIIVNNCSTDSTLSIAESYSETNKRIKVHNNEEFLTVVENWNNAIGQIGKNSKYFIILPADDLLFEDCIVKKVSLAEKYPSSVLICSYVLFGDKVIVSGLNYEREVYDGKSISMQMLLEEIDVFPPPAGFMFRCDTLKEKEEFFDPEVLHVDMDAYYRLLKKGNYAFCKNVLSFVRTHEDQISENYVKKFDTFLVEKFVFVYRYGPTFLGEQEYMELVAHRTKQYYRHLARKFLTFKRGKYWAYHKRTLKKHNIEFKWYLVAINIIPALLDSILNLQRTMDRLIMGKQSKA